MSTGDLWDEAFDWFWKSIDWFMLGVGDVIISGKNSGGFLVFLSEDIGCDIFDSLSITQF